MRRYSGWLLGLCVLTACGRQAQQRTDVGRSRTQADTLTKLIDRLGTTPGQFHRMPNGQYELTGGDSLLRPFAGLGDSAVARLVDCLDRTDSTAVIVDGHRALLGALCYEALTYVAYSEPEGSLSGDWAGVVFPNANPEQLRAAKAAWLPLLSGKRYHLN